MTGRHEGGWRLVGGKHGRQAMMQPIQQPFKGFPQIADHMPPIEDLLGLGRAQRGTTRIPCRTVTAQDDNARMRPEPCG
jgi:hypothetical protein